MSDEPFPLEPERIERRGSFPKHSDEPRPLLSADEARARARQRLDDWLATHA